ncbi:hypothetical protein P378_10265 [Desulforamulus profundi]|uniref:Uncharacterized protein n=1 Tax=Desulforamulus profundi TaxID=1383067 RepID=A0A2C6MFR0_9FIRM|nr:hypothetical protein P378_10265 [Desulforamulus profundi]
MLLSSKITALSPLTFPFLVVLFLTCITFAILGFAPWLFTGAQEIPFVPSFLYAKLTIVRNTLLVTTDYLKHKPGFLAAL